MFTVMNCIYIAVKLLQVCMSLIEMEDLNLIRTHIKATVYKYEYQRKTGLIF